MQDERSHDVVHSLRRAFRQHVETFYACLHLAPPYHSVEKAIAHLTTLLMAMSPDERTCLAGDPARQWNLFEQIFAESGLARKHRGIIMGLVRTGRTGHLPHEYTHFLNAFHRT